jgi:hypothetical protein
MIVDFTGSITTEAPMAISRKDAGGFPTMSVLSDHGQPQRVPVVPGETLKGALRAAATRALEAGMAAVAGDDAPRLNLEARYLVGIGGVKGRGSELPEDVLLQAEIRRSHPILSLFGAASLPAEDDTVRPGWMHGRLRVSHALAGIPLEKALAGLAGGARRDPVVADPAAALSLTPEDRAGYLRYAGVRREVATARARLAAADRALREASRRARGGGSDETAAEAAAQVERLTRARDGLREMVEGLTRDNADFAETIGRPLDAVAAIGVGVVFEHRLRLHRGADAELGCLLAALDAFAADPRIGGHATTGYGRVRCAYTATLAPTRPPGFPELGEGAREIGSLTIGAEGAAWQPGPAFDVVERARAAWADWIREAAGRSWRLRRADGADAAAEGVPTEGAAP